MRMLPAQPGQRLLLTLVCLSCFPPAALHAQFSFSSPPRDPVTSSLEAIERIEGESGPYAPELTDLYHNLGQSLMENHELKAARKAFHQGVFVIRVNAGPNSPLQTDYLFSVADVENLLGEARAVTDILSTIYSINAERYAEDPDRLLPVLNKLYDWYNINRPLGSPHARFLDYRTMMELALERAQINEQQKGLNHPETAVAYRSLGQSYYRSVRYVLTHGSQLEPGVMVWTLLPPATEDLEYVSVHKMYLGGKLAFTKYVQSVESKEERTALEYAEALAQLGDWELVFEKFRDAREMYEKAYQVLENEDSAALADAYMGNPTPLALLSDDGSLVARRTESPEDAEQSVRVSMTVTQNGDVRYIEILSAPNTVSEDQLSAIKKELKASVFRPGVSGGSVVQIDEYMWDYLPQSATGNT